MTPTPDPDVLDRATAITSAFPVEVQQAWWEILLSGVSVAATIGAAVVPLILFLRERQDRIAADARAAESERRREASERQHLRQAQARQVYVWGTQPADPTVIGLWNEFGKVVLHNPTDGPILRLRVVGTAWYRVDVREERQFAWYRPTRMVKAGMAHGVLPPTRNGPVQIRISKVKFHLPPDESKDRTFVSFTPKLLQFIDSDGLIWQRDLRNGTITELPKWEFFFPFERPSGPDE